MRIAVTEVLVGIAAGLIIGAGIGAVGRTIEVPSAPSSLSSRPYELLADTLGACLDAPVTGPSASDIIGQARLCRAGRSVRFTFQASGLAPGVVYTIWLGSFDTPASCSDPSCALIDVWSQIPVVPLDARRVGGDVTSPSQTLEIHGELHDVHLVSGGQVILMLLRPAGRAGPHAQATFTIP